MKIAGPGFGGRLGSGRANSSTSGARNNLLFYKDLKQGTISFDDATQGVVNESTGSS